MIVFLLGTPGCGKSAFYRRLIRRFEEEGMYSEFPRIDDFPKLWDIFMQDEKSGKWERCRKTDDGGYKVIDQTVWDDILKEVNKDLAALKAKSSNDSVIFVEFSRPNYVHSIMNNFSDDILEDAIAVYMDVPFEICWQRNVRRHEQALESGSDDHLVSREEMEKTYGSDDKDKLEVKLPFPVVFVYPDSPVPDDFTKLDEGIERTIKVLKGEAQR